MSAREKAAEAWGEPLSDWIAALAAECDRSSQNKTAVRLGISAAAVSQVLGRKYGASTAGLEELVRGVLMSETAPCPVLGDIGRQICRMWRLRARSDVLINTLHTTMRRACISCPSNPDLIGPDRKQNPERQEAKND